MRKSLLASAVVAGLGIASAAQAAVVVTYIPRGTPVGTGGAPVANGYTGYTIRLTENTGANITAVDMESANPTSSLLSNGFFGKIVQRWTSSGGDGSYDTQTINSNANQENLTPSVVNFDSHLLQPGTPKSDANYVGKIGFVEDPGAPFPPSGTPVPPFGSNTDSAGFNLGSNSGSIQAAFGINGPAQSSTLDLAYIVLPNDYVRNPTFQHPLAPDGGFGTALIAVAGGAPQLIIFQAIPEPGTIGLAGISALGLLVRRRRA